MVIRGRRHAKMGTTWHYGQIDENASAVAAW